MVTSTRTASRLMIVATPNCSASWRSNQLVLFALAVPSLGVATGFALLGAWPILPFAGLELLALGSALYYVNWKLQYRHVITLSEDTVRIEKGHYVPKRSWQFTRQGAGLAITPEAHPWDGPSLAVHDNRDSVTVGDFLCREDSLKLAELLRSEIRVASHGPSGRRHF
jgi:uncharacterized membrane protein